MKNVTVTLDEKTAKWARMEAARQDMSVSRLLRELLEEHMREKEHRAGALRRYLSRPPAKLKQGGGYPSRDEIHDRARLR
jgi:hypothetical protein